MDESEMLKVKIILQDFIMWNIIPPQIRNKTEMYSSLYNKTAKKQQNISTEINKWANKII